MALRTRKIGHSHKLTVPTTRKGLGVAQAAQQVLKSKSLSGGTAMHPGAGYGPYDAVGSTMGSGGTIHIKKANRGKFNALKKRTGKSTEELKHSKNPLTRKRATFAANARKWHHKHEEGGFTNETDFIQDMMEKAYGGIVQEFMTGGEVAAARKKPGGSNVGKKKFANGKKRTGPYAGPAGGAPKGSYPIPDIGHARAALRLAGHAPNPAGIRAKVYRKYPQLKHAEGGWIQEYADGGRTINPTMGGYMIGGQHAYPPLAPYPAMYPLGGSVNAGAMNGVANGAAVGKMFGPWGTAIGAIGGGIMGGLKGIQAGHEQQQQQMQQQALMARQQEQLGQRDIAQGLIPQFSWGGRLPETMEPMSPSGLTMGHVPGYDSDSNYGGTNIPGKGWNYRMVKGKGEGTNWHRDTNMNVRRHTYPEGGTTTGAAVTTVRNNRFIPVTERQFYDQAIRPYNDTLTYDQFNAVPPTLEDRSKYLPNSDWKIEQGKRGTTMNKGYLKYYQNNPVDMGTDITENGLPVFKQPDKSIVNQMFPQHPMYAMGGETPGMAPVELEKQEVFQTPSGQMGQVNGPSHAEGGVDMELPENSFVWSDKLKTARGNTFADEAARLGRLKAKYEKILRA